MKQRTNETVKQIFQSKEIILTCEEGYCYRWYVRDEFSHGDLVHISTRRRITEKDLRNILRGFPRERTYFQ